MCFFFKRLSVTARRISLEHPKVANCIDSLLSGEEINQYAPQGIPENCSRKSSSQVYCSGLNLLWRYSVIPLCALSLWNQLSSRQYVQEEDTALGDEETAKVQICMPTVLIRQ
jgi:hypothetical protein